MPKTVTTKEAAALLKVSEQTVWRYLKSGMLVGRKVGRQYLIPEDAVEKLQEPLMPQASGTAET